MNIDKALNIDVSQTVEIGKGDNKQHMTLYEAARWCSLLQGLDLITKKAKFLNINLDTDKSWVKPLALQKFVGEETSVAITELQMDIDNETRSHSLQSKRPTQNL